MKQGAIRSVILTLAGLLAFAGAIPEARAAADDFRKSSVTIKMVTNRGQAATKGNLTIKQTNSEVLFGANSGVLTSYGANLNGLSSENNYKAFTSVFNAVTLLEYWSLFDGGAVGSYNMTNAALAAALMNTLDQRGQLYITGHPALYNLASVQPSWITPQNQAMEYQNHLNWWLRTFDKVKVADIVNEPYHQPITTLDKFANTFTYYQQARSINPALIRRINEYDLVTGTITDDFIARLKTNINDVDAIGVQVHVMVPYANVADVNGINSMISTNLKKLAALGKPVHITEISVPSTGASFAGWTEENQRSFLVNLYTLFFNTPGVQLISYWDVSDHGAWNVSSGLWRDNVNADGTANLVTPKPAWDDARHNGLVNLITNSWRSTATIAKGALKSKSGATVTVKNGIITFTGYRGTYTVGDQTFTLTSDNNQSWTVVAQ